MVRAPGHAKEYRANAQLSITTYPQSVVALSALTLEFGRTCTVHPRISPHQTTQHEDLHRARRCLRDRRLPVPIHLRRNRGHDVPPRERQHPRRHLLQGPAGQYCPRGETNCRAPTGDLCFNPATSLFQHGCDIGFKCTNGKCVYKTTPSSAHGPICYKACPTGQYCARGETECRAPTGDLCFNPATSLFQHGCDAGFKCSHGKCVYKTTTTITTTVAAATSSEALPAHAPICYKACPTGQYCPRGETECRAPTGDLCFNPATSLFQHGCSRGFKCSHGKCVYQ